MTLEQDQLDTQALLDRLREQHQVPGAALGVLQLGETADQDVITSHASGVLNLDTLVAVRPDSIFQIGSISKTFTTTMIMQLAERQQLDLDRPVIELLPELRLGDENATRTVTLRHLLSHSSGIDGDVFTDYGRGDDAVSRYVEGLAEVPQLFTPGTMFSYCNAGFVLAGRLIEVVTGTSWDQALHDQLLQPLGLRQTATLPEEAIFGTAAVGHAGQPGEPRTVIKRWQLPRSIGPAGLINSTVADVLQYARMHLRGGSIGDTMIISPESAHRMRTEQIRQPVGQQRDGWQGLGWMVDHWDGHQVFGHNGATVGQYAYLQAFPDQRVAICLLTNGPGAGMLWARLRHALLASYGLDTPIGIDQPPADPYRLSDPVAAVGRYGRISETYEVTRTDTGLRVDVRPTEDSPDPEDEPESLELIPISQDHFVARADPSLPWSTYSHGTFTREQNPAGGDYLYTGTRLTPRLS
ncbi:serine hydrolase domain-containing protein [Microlunatus elymi]|nr:serine hydrolase domain-containing protein [Microlunatus elymi]